MVDQKNKTVMLTIKAEVPTGRVRNDGTYNVKIRFTKGRTVKRISTDLFATKEDLTADSKLKEESIIKQEADRLVLHYRMLYTSMHLDSENYDVNEIVSRLLYKDEAKKPIDFIAFSKKWISETTIKGKLFIEKVLLGKCTGISFVDSTPHRVCKNLRIHIHRTFKGIPKGDSARWGGSSASSCTSSAMRREKCSTS